MNTTHTSTTNYLKWLALSLVLLFTACNKNEDLTLIIEDGQPKISTLIVGQWRPTTISIVDRLTGEILETEEPESGSSSFWEFFEDGTFGRSDKPAERFHWQADEEDFNINIGGKQWNVDWLTKLKLRLRERMDDKRDRYYDFGRIGDFIDDGEEEEEKPKTSRVSKIIHPYDNSRELIYEFKYDEKGRILEFTYNNINTTYSITSEYTYQDNNVTVETYENGKLNSYRKGVLGNNGYLKSIELININNEKLNKTIEYSYNSNGYLIKSDINGSYQHNNNNIIPTGSNTYTYGNEKMDTNIDVNWFMTGIIFFDLNYLPFGLLGKFSNNLLSKVDLSYSDSYYTYEYIRDKEGKIIQVKRNEILKFDNKILHTYNIDIYYELY